MSLRARLLLVVATLAAVGLTVAGAATYASLRSFLVSRVDRSVAASARVLAGSLERHGDFGGPGNLEQLGASTPGIYVGLRDSAGVRWAPIGTRAGETPPPEPTLEGASPESVDADGATLTLRAVRGGTRFRARLQPLPDDFGFTLVVAAPLSDVQATLHRLLLIEVLVGLAVIGAIVGIGSWLVRVGLRPLSRIEETAGAIAVGDLGRRIEGADERTEVGRLGLALNAMLAQIEQAFAERTASEQRLRRFVGDASHELRTPLSSVQAYAELFERGARDRPEDLARAMAGIEREARRMGVLVDDLLLLARLDQGRPLARDSVDLTDVAAEAVEVARTLEPDRPLAIDAPEAVVVTGDAERLRQVVDNLLANVRAHTPRGTAATVRVHRDGGAAVLEVSDEGPGLKGDQQAHVFERFYRGDSSRSRDAGGTGLGLAIVHAIATAHDGSVTVESERRRGATFRVVLPAARVVRTAEPASQHEAPALPRA
jgi:two-component system OmpR family sensor kinase